MGGVEWGVERAARLRSSCKASGASGAEETVTGKTEQKGEETRTCEMRKMVRDGRGQEEPSDRGNG